MKTNSRHRQVGFTLLEVLIALVIFSFSSIALLRTSEQSVISSSYLEEKTIAQLIADNQLVIIRTKPDFDRLKKTELITIEMASRDWEVETKISETSLKTLKRVDVTVLLIEDDDSKQLIVATGFIGKY